MLDVAGGTGDLSARFRATRGPTGEVWLTDINNAMLTRAATGSATRGFPVAGGAVRRRKLPFR